MCLFPFSTWIVGVPLLYRITRYKKNSQNRARYQLSKKYIFSPEKKALPYILATFTSLHFGFNTTHDSSYYSAKPEVDILIQTLKLSRQADYTRHHSSDFFSGDSGNIVGPSGNIVGTGVPLMSGSLSGNPKSVAPPSSMELWHLA